MPDDFVIEAIARWNPLPIFEDPHVFARIKDSNGNPVTGLTKSNFTALNMGTGGDPIAITSFKQWPVAGQIAGTLPGTYSFKLDLSIANQAIDLVVALIVIKKVKSGQLFVDRKGQTMLGVVKLQAFLPS